LPLEPRAGCEAGIGWSRGALCTGCPAWCGHVHGPCMARSPGGRTLVGGRSVPACRRVNVWSAQLRGAWGVGSALDRGWGAASRMHATCGAHGAEAMTQQALPPWRPSPAGDDAWWGLPVADPHGRRAQALHQSAWGGDRWGGCSWSRSVLLSSPMGGASVCVRSRCRCRVVPSASLSMGSLGSDGFERCGSSTPISAWWRLSDHAGGRGRGAGSRAAMATDHRICRPAGPKIYCSGCVRPRLLRAAGRWHGGHTRVCSEGAAARQPSAPRRSSGFPAGI
jgi:hypothetical protein